MTLESGCGVCMPEAQYRELLKAEARDHCWGLKPWDIVLWRNNILDYKHEPGVVIIC